ncbi:hypothetical protein CY34DRAFT_13333 [Suillus luteus UH-Slu-Lm8-n1]|uniref:Fungal-type protein kinase domain-containing protein n=1 Tax=Suillus luteus UH-Slu-Lm8-n1 TaxID=930992 RepID=A0A0D0BC05_9AGAM|nr:hypothetical protein CY34DRAFT_13333 [Suillus luteus UH-Slu-Lm8-n1]
MPLSESVTDRGCVCLNKQHAVGSNIDTPHHNRHNSTNQLWPEEERESEAKILQKVYEIAKKDTEGKMKHHVPEMLKGQKLLSAWWDIVVCHYALWGNDVHHRDINPSNLMVYKTLDSPSGLERTGTVPVMAIELLPKEAIEGKVKHLYRHDTESFLWVLTWSSLRYKEGQLLRKGKPLDEWLKLDAIECHDEKTGF